MSGATCAVKSWTAGSQQMTPGSVACVTREAISRYYFFCPSVKLACSLSAYRSSENLSKRKISFGKICISLNVSFLDIGDILTRCNLNHYLLCLEDIVLINESKRNKVTFFALARTSFVTLKKNILLRYNVSYDKVTKCLKLS